VVVALGSNLGDSARIVRAAIERLREVAAGELRCSSLWRTSPVDCPDGSPGFINAVVAFPVGAGETPEALLARMQELEREFGRRPKVRLNEPRPLDLDLIAFGSEVRSAPGLTLPHPRAHQRRFVLVPLAEILPDFVLPGQAQTVAAALAALATGEVIERLDGV
jgi:2-amino-4-hydroxy-6-hydroxymethyldihydropteridine diphosphokinase